MTRRFCAGTAVLGLLLWTLSMQVGADRANTLTPLSVAVINDVPSTTAALNILEQAYQEHGYLPVSVTMPSRRALMESNAGTVDAELFRIAGIERSFPNLVRVPYPILRGRVYVIRHQDATSSFHPGLLANTPVAMLRGVIIEEQTAASLGMMPVYVDSYAQILAMVQRQRVPYGLFSEIADISPFGPLDWDQVQLVPQPVNEFELFHYLHQRHQELVDPLADSLRRMEERGQALEIIERFAQPLN